MAKRTRQTKSKSQSARRAGGQGKGAKGRGGSAAKSAGLFQAPGWLTEAIKSPLGREALAAALIAGAGAAAAVLAGRGKKIRSASATLASAARDMTGAAAGALAGAASEAVNDLLPGDDEDDETDLRSRGSRTQY